MCEKPVHLMLITTLKWRNRSTGSADIGDQHRVSISEVPCPGGNSFPWLRTGDAGEWHTQGPVKIREDIRVPSVDRWFYWQARFCFSQMATGAEHKSNQGNLAWRGSGIHPGGVLEISKTFLLERKGRHRAWWIEDDWSLEEIINYT